MTRIVFLCVSAALGAFLASGAYAAPVRPELGGTGCSNPATVADLASYAKDGAICQVQDGASSSDCATGSGSEVVLCCYDGSAWAACGGGAGGGSGDVTGVGDCTGDECFTVSGGTGNILYFEGTTVDGSDTILQAADPTSGRIIELPDESGTICTNGSVCTGYSSTAHTHTLGSDDDDDWFTSDSVSNVLIFEGSITTDDAYEGTLVGADFTADRTLTLPDQTGTICVNDSTTSGCGNITNSAATTDNALVAWTGTGGKTLENTECVMSDIDGDGSNDYISCPEGYTSGDQGCANNTDCNVFALAKNAGGGAPTCTTMEAGNANLLDKLFILPKSDDSVVLCDGSTEVGTVAATSSGDVATIGDCTSGDCFANGAGLGNSLIFEGATDNTYETTLTAADTTASDKTITLPNETGTVCTTGSVCTGYQAALTGLEDLESAVDHSVPVGDTGGAGYISSILPDTDPPSTTVAGTSLHYDRADQTFYASAIPTVDQWAPVGWGTANTADYPAAGAGDIDECRCTLHSVLQPIADLTDVSVRINTASDAQDILEVGIYSEDGLTQYFECTVIVSEVQGTGEATCNSAATGNGKVLQPGDYWVCMGSDSTDGTITYELGGTMTIDLQHFSFSQTCADGEMPATLTSASKSVLDANPPYVYFRNE